MQSYRIGEIIEKTKEIFPEAVHETEIHHEEHSVSLSPIIKSLNAEVLYAEKGKVGLGFQVTRNMLNPGNVLHGGIQCTMLDEAIGYAGATLGYADFLYAIDLKVDYMRPAILGQNLIVQATVVREGKNVFNCTGEIKTQDEKLISQARSNLIKKPK